MIDRMSYAALAVSLMALMFTVLSFWWLNARPGRLRSYEPTTWAAFVDRERSAIRLPLVLHNTGAATLVVIGLRLRFVEGGEMMAWEWTRTRVDPTADDIEGASAPFSIPGGKTRELVPEFRGGFPGIVPEQRAYPVMVEARSSLSDHWQNILSFDLQFKNLIHPANYIVYTNETDYLSEHELEEGATNLARMRTQFGLDAAGRAD
jgi:hypothetical protein